MDVPCFYLSIPLKINKNLLKKGEGDSLGCSYSFTSSPTGPQLRRRPSGSHQQAP